MAALLIAEDDEDVRLILQRLFTRAGYDVTTAADGMAALNHLCQNLPDVVVTDFDMPQMNGLDLARAIRADAATSRIPVMLVSGRIDPQDERVITALLCAVICKPFGNSQLVDMVHELVKQGLHEHDRATGLCHAINS